MLKEQKRSQAGVKQLQFGVGWFGLFLLVNLNVPLAVHCRVCSSVSLSEMNLNAPWIFYQPFICAKFHLFSFPGCETLRSLLNMWDKSIQVKAALEYISFYRAADFHQTLRCNWGRKTSSFKKVEQWHTLGGKEKKGKKSFFWRPFTTSHRTKTIFSFVPSASSWCYCSASAGKGVGGRIIQSFQLWCCQLFQDNSR